MKKPVLCVALGLALSGAGCIAGPQSTTQTPAPIAEAQGPVLVKKGKLLLKGNAPFLQPVLATQDGEYWALSDLSGDASSLLQNKSVIVRGTAEAAPAGTPQLPRLQVLEISLAP